MGCGRSALADDEDELDTLLTNAEVKGKLPVEVYSTRADIIEEGYKRGMIGEVLLRYVALKENFNQETAPLFKAGQARLDYLATTKTALEKVED